MILSDQDMREMMKKGKIKIEPLEDDQIGGASVDLTLSDQWYFFKNKYLGKKAVDLSKVPFQEAFEMKKAKTIELMPQQMCLAKTVEKITLAGDIMGKLEGRSRFARMGLIIHITSALVQPGSSNHQVLEIVNLAPFPIKIHSGMRISQVLFEQLKTNTKKPYAKFGQIARKQ
ncbi:dCTP deaminase [Candidatus Micrarchaeota archaeon]|nr:dCTP deaminase [Candidatus Micrarchaeota archaeon]